MTYNNHEPFIRETLRLAQQAVENGNHPFGAVLVHNGEVLLRAQNAINTYNDLAQHPEIVLARSAASRYEPNFLKDCILYASTEPCAMCAGAIYWSGIGKVVFACSVETLAKYARDSIGMPCSTIFDKGSHPVEVIGHVLEEEATVVHKEFWK